MQNESVMLCIDSADGSSTYSDGLSFRFISERYTPYTTLTAVFSNPLISLPAGNRIRLLINGATVHDGLVDRLDYRTDALVKRIYVTSKSFTSLLCQNQMTPGLVPNVSLHSLLTDYYTIPNVAGENDTTQANYIFCRDGSTLWDAITNLSQKLYNAYPYIRGTNTVLISAPLSPSSVTISNPFSSGILRDYTKLVSHYHMQDINGTYNTYNLTNPEAEALNIVRHKEIALDRQHLNDPLLSLGHKIKFCMRGYLSEYWEYAGYCGEQLLDSATVGGASHEISRIEISGSRGLVKTRLSAYHDSYCNV